MDEEWQWEAVYSNGGKPWSEKYNNDKELYDGLKKFYDDFVKDDDGHCDVQVFNNKDEDCSESQHIREMISEIMENLK